MFVRFLFFIILLPSLSFAAIIVKTKGNRCFVHLEGTSAVVGDHFTALDLFGKARGIIRLDKIKNGKAIATLVDGRADANWLLERTTQTQLENVSVSDSLKKNNIGFMLSAGRITIKKEIRDIQRQYGWSMGGLLFFEWPFRPSFSLNIAGGGVYYNINSETEGVHFEGSNRSGSLRMSGFPSFQTALKFHIPIASKINMWISAGGGFSKWNNVNNNWDIFDKTEFRIQPFGQIMMGMDFNVPNTKYTIPLSIGYTCVQCGGEWFDKNILNKQPKPDHTSLNVSEITLHIGISQPI